jgi:enolase
MLHAILEAIINGLRAGKDIVLGLDAAATEFYDADKGNIFLKSTGEELSRSDGGFLG